jgi:alanine racemase
MPYGVTPTLGPVNIRGAAAQLDRAALVHNLDVARRHADGAEVMCVVKADGYGHGARRVTPVLERAGCEHFGVATVEEGLELREEGVAGTILVLGGACWLRAPSMLVHARLTPLLSSAEELATLADHLRRHPPAEPLCAHVKIDTGMSRIGVPVGDDPEAALAPLIELALATPELRITGAATHFANADLHDEDFTDVQAERFGHALAMLLHGGLPLEVAHLSNSAATLELPGLTKRHGGPLDVWVRPGLMLYGISPFADRRYADELRPVMSWTAPIVARKRVPAGTPVSYGSTFTCERETELAVIGTGYADGYPRSISGKGAVLIGGRRAPIRGRVCMDLFVVDVTDVAAELGPAACDVGASVTLLGRDGDEEIDCYEVADWADTIPYEIITRVGARVPRQLSP